MNKYIALLRGINVSGQKKIKMEDLREMCQKIGFQKVQTYIQSGNIIFETTEKSIPTLEKNISEAILQTFGFEVETLVRTFEYFQETLNNNPFLSKDKNIDIKFLHVTFLAKSPSPELIQKLAATNYGTEQYEIVEDKIYLYFPDGYGKAKLNNATFEQKLKVGATTRNWNTVINVLIC